VLEGWKSPPAKREPAWTSAPAWNRLAIQGSEPKGATR
jgi:hypothetical protein